MIKLKVGRHTFDISSLDKVLFPKENITKKDLLTYYTAVAPFMLPYTQNRFLSMQRWPDGIEKEGFFQKNAQAYFPGWIKTFEVKKQEEGVTRYVIANNEATLVYLANHGCITFHVALSKIDKIMYPDRMIFDLDPSVEDFSLVIWAALELKKVLQKDGLVPFVMTTGSRGVHVVVPLQRRYPFEYVEYTAQLYARQLVDKYPEKLTVAFYKKSRKDRIFIDTLRNQYGATAVCPYSVRAGNGAPVAWPLFWKDLKQVPAANYFKLKNMSTYLLKYKNPWKNIQKNACLLPKLSPIHSFIEYPRLWEH